MPMSTLRLDAIGHRAVNRCDERSVGQVSIPGIVRRPGRARARRNGGDLRELSMTYRELDDARTGWRTCWWLTAWARGVCRTAVFAVGRRRSCRFWRC